VNIIKKRFITFILISIGIHYILGTLIPELSKRLSKTLKEEETFVYLEPIPNVPKITFTNQKVNKEKPDRAQFLAQEDNRTEKEVKNLKEFEPEEFKNPHISPEIKLPDDGDELYRSALRHEQHTPPTLEEYLENFEDKDNIDVSDYVDINTQSFKYISYFKRLKQRIEFVMSLPQEARFAGINGIGIVGFSIGADGKLESFEIIESTFLTRACWKRLIKQIPMSPCLRQWDLRF